MKHSPRASRAIPAVLVLLDLAARLSLPAALLALTHGFPGWALSASLGTALCSAARSVLLGFWTERVFRQTWRRAVDAARRQPSSALKIREQGEVAALVEAVREHAAHEAQMTPRIAALVLTLGATAALVVVLLGPSWILFGAVAAVVPGTIAAMGRRRLHRAYERVWEDFSEAARDTGVLIEASVELRAHACEDAFAAALLRRIDAMSRQERIASGWEAVMAILPASLGVAAVAAPVRAGAAWAVTTLGSAVKLADVGILGGTALVTGLALVHAWLIAVRAAPQRRTLRDFLERSARSLPPPAGGTAALSRSLADAAIELDAVSCVYPGASHATPAAVSLRWSERRGLAVCGPNGAGKSTLALVLLGLLAPAEGRIAVDGIPLDQLDLDAYRRRIVFVPQGAFFAPGEPVAWHMGLYGHAPIPDERVDQALAEVGLYPVLAERAARSGKAPRDVLAGELSGGERQRMHLARALLHDAELVILDEPEAALDDAGRRTLSGLLERLAGERKVLVIAHDASIVPASFERLECRRGQGSS